MENYYVYILTNEYNKVLYTGVTNNLPRRIEEHKNELIDGFSKKYHTHKLIYAEKYDDPTTAILREKQIKGYTRSKKVELINSINPKWKEILPY